MKTLIEGAVLAILVVLVFLRDWRATLIAAIALPLSIIPAFWAMEAMGFSLNLVSLLAITIVTGILVDDAIVEIENIVRHMRMGKSPYRAALEAADEIGLAVIAITITIIAVFTPVSFMGGIAGQYFKQFGLVVAAAVFFSLLVARLVTPLLAAYFLRDTRPRGEGRLAAAHLYAPRRAGRCAPLQDAWRSAPDLRRLDRQLLSCCRPRLPAAGGHGPQLLAIELPPGSRLDDTRAVDRDRREPHPRAPRRAAACSSTAAICWARGAEVRKATLIINLVPKAERKLNQAADQGRDRPRSAPACPTSATGSCKTTASANSSSSSPAAIRPPSRRSRPS